MKLADQTHPSAWKPNETTPHRVLPIRRRTQHAAFGLATSEQNLANPTAEPADHIFGFTGREQDDESDLNFYRARYYDPAVARFISQDPISFEAGDANLYRYVGNGPTNATDPSGLAPQTSYTVTPVGPQTGRSMSARVAVPGGEFNISSKLQYRKRVSTGNSTAQRTTVRTTVTFTANGGNCHKIKLAVLRNTTGMLERNAEHFSHIATERGWFIASAALAFDLHVTFPPGGHSIFPGDYFPPDASEYPGLDMSLFRIDQWAGNSGGVPPRGQGNRDAWFEDYKRYFSGTVPGMTWTSRHYYVGAYDSVSGERLGFMRFSILDKRIKEAGEVAVQIKVYHPKSTDGSCVDKGMGHMPSDFYIGIERFEKQVK